MIFLTENDVETLYSLFPEDNFYVPSKEVIQSELSRSSMGHFNVWGFKNRRKLEFNDSFIYLAPSEYVIVKKLAYWEEGKHQKYLDDIEKMLLIEGEDISLDEISSKLSSELQKSELNKISGQD